MQLCHPMKLKYARSGYGWLFRFSIKVFHIPSQYFFTASSALEFSCVGITDITTKTKMASSVEDFPNWLREKLKELNTDETVFGSYILGILDSDESAEEKTEAIQGLLTEILENDNEIAKISNEILEQWLACKPKEEIVQQMSSEYVNIKLAKLMESQSLATTKQKQYTAEEKKIREAILSQYSEMPDEEGETKEDNSGNGEGNIEKNLNAQTVAQAEKIKREQAKVDSQKKKEKDKEDREKQKQVKEEKKEKRKTVKGERKR